MKHLLVVAGLVFVTACGARALPEHDHEEDASDAHEAGPAVVKASLEMQEKWGIEVAPVARVPVTAEVAVPGVIALDQTRSAQISPLVEGKVADVRADLGQAVRVGQVLAVVHSPAFSRAQAAFLSANARRELASKEFERAKALLQQEAIEQKEYLRRQAEYEAAATEYALQESTMHSLGLDHARLNALVEMATDRRAHPSDLTQPNLPIASPIAGRVIFRDVVLGEYVAPGKVLFTVADLSTVWAVLDARETDLPSLTASAKVSIRSTVYPDRTFEGRNLRVGDVVDEKLRTVKVRVDVPNAGLLLKPNMYVNGVVHGRSGTVEALAVPEEAVQSVDGEPAVFARSGPDTFSPRPVALGQRVGERRVVLKGLQGSESIAVKGAFTLKAELMKKSLGGGHQH